MNKMTLPSRHRIRKKLISGSLRASTPPLGHGGSQQYRIFTGERGRIFFISLKLEGQSGARFKATILVVFTHNFWLKSLITMNTNCIINFDRNIGKPLMAFV